ncbi:MAG: replication-associated recombination protein A [Armatimonadetes bacterium]|nr:replication-associated recombination protein A [Armatimonadota bacterium]
MDDESPSPGLFPDDSEPQPESHAPLAARMRPRTLEEFAGQGHVIGPGSMLRQAIERDRMMSVVFWGPPGCGKSTLASIIARHTNAVFESYSAVTSGVADVRKVIERAAARRKVDARKTILFVDEIHRWNKAQQDALLPHVENGTVTLIGATTENPYFEVNAPLISRSRVLRFHPLSSDDLRALVERALSDTERGLGGKGIEASPDAVEHIVDIAGGDARTALNILEIAAQAATAEADGRRPITLAHAEEAAQQRALGYDRRGDEHYDTISAFIKSVRGSDPDAALYWLAKMLRAGEDPMFIARRLVILASEDIGNADPQGLVVAAAAAQAVHLIGLPEGRLTLAQATTYLAAAPKSNASYVALTRAEADIQRLGAAPVPLHLRNAPHPALGQFGHGKGYRYPHDYPGAWVEQEYAPESARSGPYYEPTENGYEARIKARMEARRPPGGSGDVSSEATP